MLACSNNPNLCEVSWMSIVSFSLPRAIWDHKCVRHLDPPFSSAQCAFFCPKNKLLSICVVRIIVFQYFKIFILLFNSYLLLAIKEYAAWSRAMIRLHILRWSKNNFDRGLVRCNALIIFIGLSPRYSPHAYSTIFIMIRDAYSTIFIMIRGGYPERKQPWGRHWTPWDPRLFISLMVNRTFLNTQISSNVLPYLPYNPYRRCAKGTE